MEFGHDIFKDEELDELKQLTLKHRRGQMSDLDFEEQVAWLLRGRSFPILTNDPRFDLEDKNAAEPKKQKELSALTSCGERSKRARQSYFRKHKESKQESYVAKTIKIENAETLATKLNESLNNHVYSSTSNAKLSESLGKISGSISSATISAVNQSIENATEEKKLINIVYILLGVIGVITIVLLYLFFGKQRNDEVVSINQLSPLLIAHDQNPDLPTIFGPITVSQCNALCLAKNADNCENACRKLSFEMFPHRITIDDNNPEKIADELENKCIQTFKKQKKSSKIKLPETLLSANTIENMNLNELNEEFTNISKKHASLQKSPKDNKNLEKSSIALCLRANEVISYIGAKVASGYRDHYAVAYYQLMQRALANKNAKYIKN